MRKLGFIGGLVVAKQYFCEFSILKLGGLKTLDVSWNAERRKSVIDLRGSVHQISGLGAFQLVPKLNPFAEIKILDVRRYLVPHDSKYSSKVFA